MRIMVLVIQMCTSDKQIQPPRADFSPGLPRKYYVIFTVLILIAG